MLVGYTRTSACGLVTERLIPQINMHQVARRFGVSLSTLYRYLPGGRAALEEENQERNPCRVSGKLAQRSR